MGRGGDAAASGTAQALVRTIYLSLDPTNRGWAAGDTYLPAVPLDGVMRGIAIGRVEESRAPGLAPGDVVQGLLGWQRYAVLPAIAAHEAAAHPAAALGPPRPARPHRPHRLGGPPAGRPAEGGRDARRLGGGGGGRLARRADREDPRDAGRRRRRDRREVPLADRGAGLRRRGQLQEGAGPRRAPPRVPERHRRLLRQRGRGHARRRPLAHQPARPHRRLRPHLAVQRHRPRAGAEEPPQPPREAGPDGGLHRPRPPRPGGEGGGRPRPLAPGREAPVPPRRGARPRAGARSPSTGSSTARTPASSSSGCRRRGRRDPPRPPAPSRHDGLRSLVRLPLRSLAGGGRPPGGAGPGHPPAGHSGRGRPEAAPGRDRRPDGRREQRLRLRPPRPAALGARQPRLLPGQPQPRPAAAVGRRPGRNRRRIPPGSCTSTAPRPSCSPPGAGSSRPSRTVAARRRSGSPTASSARGATPSRPRTSRRRGRPSAPGSSGSTSAVRRRPRGRPSTPGSRRRPSGGFATSSPRAA